VLQCVAVCCSVLQCVAAENELQWWPDKMVIKVPGVAARCSALQCVAVCCSVLQCVAAEMQDLDKMVMEASVLQCVVLCCSAL